MPTQRGSAKPTTRRYSDEEKAQAVRLVRQLVVVEPVHSHCHDVPPAEFEAAFYAAPQTDPIGVGNQ